MKFDIPQIEPAIKCTRASLLLSPDQSDVWHLLSLLLSSKHGWYSSFF